jgi:DNA-binding MarR family transcriptional regulator
LVAASLPEFGYLRDLIEVSDSLLSKHIAQLESAGYVRVIKGYHGKRPRTWLSLTPTGSEAFARYLAALREIVENPRSGRAQQDAAQQPPGPPRRLHSATEPRGRRR